MFRATGKDLLRSSDCGTTWSTVLAQPLDDVAIAPSNPKIVYAFGNGSAEANGSEGPVFRSADGGDTWVKEEPAGFLLVHPTNPNQLLGNLGCYISDSTCQNGESRDGGRSWNGIGSYGYDTPAAFDPRDPRIVYGVADQGLVKSTDGGRTWRGMSKSDREFAGIVAPRHDLLYAYGDALLKSTDGGRTWRDLTKRLGVSEAFMGNNVGALTVCPSDPSMVFAGTRDGIRVTVDAGRHWKPFTPALPPQTNIRGIFIAQGGSALVVEAFLGMTIVGLRNPCPS